MRLVFKVWAPGLGMSVLGFGLCDSVSWSAPTVKKSAFGVKVQGRRFLVSKDHGSEGGGEGGLTWAEWTAYVESCRSCPSILSHKSSPDMPSNPGYFCVLR
jgi:hypothetical protein